MFNKYKWMIGPSVKISMLEQYVLSKNPSTLEDINYWGNRYNLSNEFITNVSTLANVK
jgi:hypothetical protein